jgi:hypothetical protein
MQNEFAKVNKDVKKCTIIYINLGNKNLLFMRYSTVRTVYWNHFSIDWSRASLTERAQGLTWL